MTTHRTYGQFCALARALDHIGDRWTLLIVRELLRGPRSFAALRRGLDGVSTALLTERLQSLVADGLVVRGDGPQRSKAVTYALTASGRDLEPVLLALVRWGGRWMAEGPGDDHYDPAWALIALKAYVHDTPVVGSGAAGRVLVDVDGVQVSIELRGGRRTLVDGVAPPHDAVVSGSMPEVLAVAGGLLALTDSTLELGGDTALAAQALHD